MSISESKWLKPLTAVFESGSSDLRELACLVGADPAKFYIGQNLRGCDLRGQDLSGMDLTATNIAEAILDESTRIDLEFDPRPFSDYVQIRIREEVYALALAYAKSARYVYRAWGLKSLLDKGVLFRSHGLYVEFLEKNEPFRRLLDMSLGRTRKITIHVVPAIRNVANRLDAFGNVSDFSSYNALILLGIVAAQRSSLLKKNFADFDPLALYADTREFLDGIRKGRRYIS